MQNKNTSPKELEATPSLLTAEDHYRLVMLNAAIGMAVVAPEGRFLEVNPALCRIIGYSEQELLERDFRSITHPDELEGNTAFIRQLLDGEFDTYQINKRYLHKDGHTVWGQLSISLIRDDAGKPRFFIAQVQDISESKQFELERENEIRRRQMLMESSMDGIAIFNQEHRLVEANQRFAEMLGYSMEELLTLHSWDIDANMSEEDIRNNFADFETTHVIFETQHVRKDGSIYAAEVSIGGTKVGDEALVFTVTRDISERKQAEAELRGSEQAMKEAQLIAKLGTWELDLQTNLLNWSEEMYRIFDKDPLQFSPDFEQVMQDVHPDDRDIVNTSFSQAITDKTQYELIHRLLIDGQVKYIEAKGGAFYDHEGNPVRAIGTVQDITEQKQVEAELERHRNQLQELVEAQTARVQMQARIIDQVHDSIISTDLDGNITSWNQGATRLFGFSAERMLGKHIADVYPSEEHEFLAENVIKPLQQKGKHEIEVRMQHADGTPFYAHLSLSLLFDDNGTAIGMVGYSIDITERRAAEQALQNAKEAAEAANIAKSAFLANMSHEIRTPLTAIAGMTDLLRLTELTDKQCERLNNIDIASQHLLDVINAILDLSKIEAGKFELDSVKLNLEEIVSNVAKIIAEPARTKGLRVITENQAANIQLLGDPVRLQQALLNYATNAIKFTENGCITIRIIPVDVEPDSALISFRVEDTGIGIEQDTQKKLFSAFEQADNSITRKYGGTGLGLAITQKIAGLLGGQAGVESTPGIGSAFWFTARLQKDNSLSGLPKAQGNRESARDILLHDYPGHRILIVDDEPANRLLVSTFFAEEAGQIVDEAEDGIKAVEAVKQQRYDLILMDVQMPKMDGLEATRQIRLLTEGEKIPILAMTANAFKEDKLRCLDAGMNDFISKPFDLKAFYATVLKWFRQADEEK